jgi:hypothetical protein
VLQSQIANIPAISSSTEDSAKRYEQVQEQQEKAVQRVNISGVSEDIQKNSYQEAYNKINNSSAQLSESRTKQEQLSKGGSELINKTAQGVQLAKEAETKSEEGAKANEASGKATATYVEEQGQKAIAAANSGSSSSSSDCSLSWVPLIGDYICELWNGIGALVKYVIGIICFAIGVCLIGLCVQSGCCSVFCKCLCRSCSPTRRSFAHSYGSDDEAEEEEEHREAKLRKRSEKHTQLPTKDPDEEHPSV